MVCHLGEDLPVALRVQGAWQAIGDLNQGFTDFTRRVQCSSIVRQHVPREKPVLASKPGVLLSLFPLAFLGVVTIVVSGIAVLMEHSVVRGFPYFKGLVPGDGLSRIPFQGLVVMLDVMEPIPMSMCLTLCGLLPQYSGIIVGDGYVLYFFLDEEDIWDERAWCDVRAPAISFESGAVITIVDRVPAATSVPGLPASLRRVIQVHARVGDVDKGVHRDRSAASVGQVIGATTVLGSPATGAILHGAEAYQFPCTLDFLDTVLARVG